MGECMTEVSSTEGHNRVKMKTVDPLTDFGCLSVDLKQSQLGGALFVFHSLWSPNTHKRQCGDEQEAPQTSASI